VRWRLFILLSHISLPPGKYLVGCWWVLIVKVGPDGCINRLDAQLVAKGYTQIFGLDHGDTFSPVTKMTSVRLFLSIAAMHHWPLYRWDIKNLFYMGTYKKKFIQSNHHVLLLRSLVWFEVFGVFSMVGLKQSRVWFAQFKKQSANLAWFRVRRIIRSSIITKYNLCIYHIIYVTISFTSMIFLSQVTLPKKKTDLRTNSLVPNCRSFSIQSVGYMIWIVKTDPKWCQ
jgi:hypothetical protein